METAICFHVTIRGGSSRSVDAARENSSFKPEYYFWHEVSFVPYMEILYKVV